MKMTDEHFEQLKTALYDGMRQMPLMRDNYFARGKSEKTWRWDLLYCSLVETDQGRQNGGHFVAHCLYRYLNGAEIDKALEVITDPVNWPADLR